LWIIKPPGDIISSGLQNSQKHKKWEAIMKIGILSNEYPQRIRRAGVHVEYLTAEMAKLNNGEHTV